MKTNRKSERGSASVVVLWLMVVSILGLMLWWACKHDRAVEMKAGRPPAPRAFHVVPFNYAGTGSALYSTMRRLVDQRGQVWFVHPENVTSIRPPLHDMFTNGCVVVTSDNGWIYLAIEQDEAYAAIFTYADR